MKEIPTILIDTREKAPYLFSTFKRNGKPLEIQTRRQTLQTGDYSILGMEDRISIERKSIADFYSSITQQRNRFEREFARLAEFERSAVIVEGRFSDVTEPLKFGRRISRNTITGTVSSWFIRYGVPFWFLANRTEAERFTLDVLLKFWEQKQ